MLAASECQPDEHTIITAKVHYYYHFLRGAFYFCYGDILVARDAREGKSGMEGSGSHQEMAPGSPSFRLGLG